MAATRAAANTIANRAWASRQRRVVSASAAGRARVVCGGARRGLDSIMYIKIAPVYIASIIAAKSAAANRRQAARCIRRSASVGLDMAWTALGSCILGTLLVEVQSKASIYRKPPMYVPLSA